jgi:hypothetical protein
MKERQELLKRDRWDRAALRPGRGLCTGVFSSARIVPDRFRNREPIRAFETFERGPLNVVVIYRLFENLPAVQ